MSEAIPPLSGNPPPPKTSGLAIWSLVLGILSLSCFSIFAAIPGVICGHKALSRIKSSGGAIPGQGLAIGGLVTGYLGIFVAIFIIPLMFAIAIPNFVKARDTAMKNLCANNLSQIAQAKNSWALLNKKLPTDVPTESDLAEYLKGGHLPKCPAGGEYKINAVGEPPTCSIPSHQPQ
jgi:competence protein ComGC